MGEAEQSVLYSCRQCERPLRHLGYDGLCDPCAGQVDAEEEARKRDCRRWLLTHTASLLRRLGFAERAAWHELEAQSCALKRADRHGTSP
jgi:hypothetical protein